MSEITREHAFFNIRTVLNAFVNKVENAKGYIEYLSPEGKDIVQAYESDKDNCKTLLFAAKENDEFFNNLSDEEFVEYVNICYELNKLFGLRVKNLYKVTKIKDCGEYKLICEEEGFVSLPFSKDFSIVKINEKKVNFLTALIKRVDWQLLDSREKILDEMSFKDITDLNPFTRTIEFPDKGTYTVRAKIYTEGFVSETLTDVLDYKQTINGAEVNLSLYDKSWIVVKNESGQIEKIIFNEGNGITFVNRYGEVIEKIPFDSSISKTKFLDNHLGVEDSNKILINAHYTYNKDKGVFEEGNGAKRCFDLEGNDAPFEFDIRPINGKKKIKNKTLSKSETTASILPLSKIEAETAVISNKDVLKLNENDKVINFASNSESIYYKQPKDFVQKFNPETMSDFIKDENGHSKCNLFLEKVTSILSEEIAKKILPNGVKLAKELYKDWQTNENLECINPKGHFDKNRNASQKAKDAELAGNKANEFANQGYLVLAASPDFDYVTTSGTKHYTAHVSIVITQDTKYNYDAVGDDQTCFLASNGYTGHQGRKEPEVLRDYPVFFQAGNSTGIVPPGWAFSRGLFINDKVDYYVVKI